MKCLIRFLFIIFTFVNIAHADTITVEWLGVDGTTATETTCNSGDDLTLPNITPTKTGYNFVGWEIPKYIPLEYIENVPGDSYLDTGFIPDPYTKMVIDAKRQLYVAGDGCVIAGIQDQNNVKFALTLSYGNYDTYATFQYDRSKVIISNCTPGIQRHVYSAVHSDGLYIDDTKVESVVTVPSGSMGVNLFIFAKSAEAITGCTHRLYSMQLYNENTLVHDYVPAMDPNGNVCLYDKATDTFLYNLGSEPLVGGPVIDYE